MIRKLLATTAVATLISTGAMAQTTTVPAENAQPGVTVQDPAMQNQAATQNQMVVQAAGNLASNIIGETVYNSAADGAESIGEVNDIVIGADGNIEALIIGVGGFLGIGQKDVAIEYDLAEWVERDGDRWIVVPTTTDALKAQPDFDRLAYQPTPAGTVVGETRPATAQDLAVAPADGTAAAPATDGQATTMAPADGTTAAPATDGQAMAPAAGTDDTRTAAIDRSTLQPLAAEELTADNLIGTTVYGVNDENVGEVGDLVLSQDGQIDAVLLDVGGFLGIGEKEVAIGMDRLEFMRDENGNRYLYTPFTQEQLEAQPEYDEATYANGRDQMRMVVPN
ncbi:PRC-barrel domain containing protein [Aquibium carbonis]|uniref:PRC-barrel domain containing protein n=1 Tax=Aquibium carbonis TaxID=2495581 RepID=A0A3S0A6Q8_9HYPH|nr:PRC-barrel domain-containing protein [Aquibium carbonis]RST85096.1 PRC-barrel domain containing protein [Aquibium carbonis]